MSRIYCVDTDAFLAMWQDLYPVQAFPSLWVKIDQLISDERLISCRAVYDELRPDQSGIFEWAKSAARKPIFIDMNDMVDMNLAAVMKGHSHIVNHKARKSQADPFVIATAMAYNATVVTQEKPAGNGARHPKIPNVCLDLGVDCMNALEMILNEKFSF